MANESLSMLGLTQIELDEAMTASPSIPSRLLSSGLFREKNLTSTSVMIEFADGVFNLVPNRSRDEAPNIKAYGKGSVLRTFNVPHLPLLTTIRGAQIQDVRKIGSKDALLSNAQVIADEIAEHRDSHDLTIEHLMLGAVKGKILDADGKTIIYDLFDEFGISEPETSIKFSNKTTDIGAVIVQTLRMMKKGLKGYVSSGATVLCSPGFFDKLISHESTRDAWRTYKQNELQRQTPNETFTWNGMCFEVYDAEIDGVPMITDGHAHAFLTGMQRGFVRYNAPSVMLSEANKIARPFYISTEMLEHNRGVSIYTEANPLPLCLRPGTLMHLKAA